MRALLRRLILWALASGDIPPGDPSGIDAYAAQQKRNGN